MSVLRINQKQSDKIGRTSIRHQTQSRRRRFLENEHMKVELSSTYTESQNRVAERSGGVRKDKSADNEGAKLLVGSCLGTKINLKSTPPQSTFTTDTSIF